MIVLNDLKRTPLTELTLKLVSIALCVLVLIEVNYPLLQPQSSLALFGLLGLIFLFLHLPIRKRREPGKYLLLFDRGLCIITLLCFGYVIIQTEPLFSRWWIGGSTLGDRAGQEVVFDYVIGFVGLALILEATRRAIGWTLPLLALMFLAYARFGPSMPDWLLLDAVMLISVLLFE